jgi:hypothetical protein
MAKSAPSDDGMDILKFFIAIMSFLTVLVAGLAGYNWSRATSLDEEIDGDVRQYESIEKIASDDEFKKMIARDRANKDQVDVLKKDLGQFLNDTATRMNIQLANFEKMGATGLRQQGFDKFSCRFMLDKVELSTVVEYLFYLQLAWPGLKIEKMTVTESPKMKKDDPVFPGWRVQVTVSIFREKGA